MTKSPCIGCWLESMPKNNSVCEKACIARVDYYTTGEWDKRPGIQNIKFYGAQSAKAQIKRHIKKGHIAISLGYMSMEHMLDDIYPSSLGARDTAEKINKRLAALNLPVTISSTFINYHLHRCGLPVRKSGGWRGGKR